MPTLVEDKVSKILSKHEKLKQEKTPWLPTYQLIGKYVMSRKQNFTRTTSQGEFLTGQIYDSTAARANHLMASYLVGALYPNGAKSFQIEPPQNMDKEQAGSAEVKEYFEKVSQTIASVMDNPKSGFLLALEEYMLDQGAFGISGILVKETDDDLDNPVRFEAVDAKKISIDEGPDGFVDTVYIEKELTIKQLIQEYGIENVSKASRDAFSNNQMDKKVHVLQAVEPREVYDVMSPSKLDAQVASCHVEVDTKHLLKESGFQEMPVFVTRFWKAMGEKYGRSPAMEGMSDIREVNALRQASIVATEKMLDPPLLVTEDGTMGGGVLDTSAGAISVRRISGRLGDINQNPVQQLVTVGEMNSTFKRITELQTTIQDGFFIDRLADLNNETRMTLGEANIRNELRGQSLGTIYSRQLAELFTRVIERVFNILMGRGYLGVAPNSQEAQDIQLSGGEPLIIPEAVLDLMIDNKDAWKPVFISPAARIMRYEEMKGIQLTMEFVAQSSAIMPEVIDNIDIDKTVRFVQDLNGAPSQILRSLDDMKKTRDVRAQQQAQQAQMMAAQAQAETAKTGAQAAQSAAKAGIPPQAFLGGGAA